MFSFLVQDFYELHFVSYLSSILEGFKLIFFRFFLHITQSSVCCQGFNQSFRLACFWSMIAVDKEATSRLHLNLRFRLVNARYALS